MRKDFFIIWGDGLKYIPEITEMIKQEFEIIFTKSFNFFSLNELVRNVYKFDTVDIAHLQKKCEYLRDYEKTIYFFLVENHNPDLKEVKRGKLHYRWCERMNQMKIKIRARFNPEKKYHVIHTSDFPEQVDHVLKYFGIC